MPDQVDQIATLPQAGIDSPTLEDILQQKHILEINGEKIVLDPAKMQFTDASLTSYLQQEVVWYNYFGGQLALAEAEMLYHESRHEALEGQKFAEFKAEGGSDKLADAKAKADPEVKKAAKTAITARYKVRVLQQHLRSWDKNHENANNRYNTIRKELDKLSHESYKGGEGSSLSDLDQKLDDIIGKSSET